MIRLLKFLIGLFLSVVLATLGYAFWLCYRAEPETTGTIRFKCLQHRVEVLRDSIGVPHILAETFDDAILAQGYVTAQDRLWQMDLLRRLGYGELSEILGSRALETDKEQRTLGFKRLVARQEENLDSDELHILRRYAEGVNAFIM